ncbi:MAG: carboxyl transferase domain-containing protein [Lachnospiraceae bacterium]|nr:carboxyl transferase domain-containing protein [Lachnospiraceae bacterium]MDY4999665.1 carboxyl transferase domain-containing protein [Lachnospiraceae bacterium]
MSTTSKASQRIASLLDENSFVEIGAKVTARATDFNVNANDTPSDGVVTGYGVIDGNLVYVYSQDASVMGGSIGEMHAKKIVNLYDMALKMGAPVIGLIDSTGLRLEEATDALNAFGELYASSALASGVIPQISAVFGSCGGGLSLVPALSDFVFMEKSAKMFVNSPDGICGNNAAKCDNSASDFQAAETGVVDMVADEATIYASIRELVAMLPSNCEATAFDECEDDLNRACEGIEGCVGDTSIAVSMLADNGFVFETKADFAKDMYTALIKINGDTVGVVANRTEVFDEEGNSVEKFDCALSAKGAQKAAEFVNFCDAFEIPVVTLTNVAGFKACMCCEKRAAKEAAALTAAFANATVPKVNVIIGQAFGTAGVVMNSKALGADMVFAWDSAKIGMMDSKFAAQIICSGKDADAVAECAKKYDELQNSVDSAARRGYVDTIIAAADTRKYVAGALDMLYTKAVDTPAKKHVAK